MSQFSHMLLLAACGGQPEPTATPTQTPMPTTAATSAPEPTPTPLVAATSAQTSTLEAFGAEIASAVVANVADDAVAFVLEQGTANVTAEQLTAALLGVAGRLLRSVLPLGLCRGMQTGWFVTIQQEAALFLRRGERPKLCSQLQRSFHKRVV